MSKYRKLLHEFALNYYFTLHSYLDCDFLVVIKTMIANNIYPGPQGEYLLF
jgi:hypothetical protein